MEPLTIGLDPSQLLLERRAEDKSKGDEEDPEADPQANAQHGDPPPDPECYLPAFFVLEIFPAQERCRS